MKVLPFDKWLNEATQEEIRLHKEKAALWSQRMKSAILETFPESEITATSRQVTNGTLMVRLKSVKMLTDLYEKLVKPRLKEPIDVDSFVNTKSGVYAIYHSSNKVQQGRTSHPITSLEETIGWLKDRLVSSALDSALKYCREDKTIIPRGLSGYYLNSNIESKLSSLFKNWHFEKVTSEAARIGSPLNIYMCLLLLDPRADEVPEKMKESAETSWYGERGGHFWVALRAYNNVPGSSSPPPSQVYVSLEFRKKWKGERIFQYVKLDCPHFKLTNCSLAQIAERLEEPYKSLMLEAEKPDLTRIEKLLVDSRGKIASRSFGF